MVAGELLYDWPGGCAPQPRPSPAYRGQGLCPPDEAREVQQGNEASKKEQVEQGTHVFTSGPNYPQSLLKRQEGESRLPR